MSFIKKKGFFIIISVLGCYTNILYTVFTFLTIYFSYKYYENYQKEKKVQKELNEIKKSFEIDRLHLLDESNS